MPHALRSLLLRITLLLAAAAVLSLPFAIPIGRAAAEERKAKPKKAPAKEAGKEAAAAEEEEAEDEEEAEEEEEEEAEEPAAAAGKEKRKGATSVADPSVEQLAMLNARELFGGKLKITGDSFQVVFDGDGQMQAGFESKDGVVDTKSDRMKGANRKFLRLKDSKPNEPEILVPGLTAVGMGEGLWTSKFPVAGNVWMEFGFRVPNLIDAESNLRVRINWNKEGKSGYETSFFQTISYFSNGVTKATSKTPYPQYHGLPMDWFQRQREPTKIEFGIRDGKCLVRMGGKEMVSVSKVADKGGRIGFLYSKLLFTVDNLKISGKLDREWLKKRLDELKSKKKLKTAPDPEPPAGG